MYYFSMYANDIYLLIHKETKFLNAFQAQENGKWA